MKADSHTRVMLTIELCPHDPPNKWLNPRIQHDQIVAPHNAGIHCILTHAGPISCLIIHGIHVLYTFSLKKILAQTYF